MPYRFIWKITIKDPQRIDEFVSNWKEGSSILQTYPGARGTRIHKLIDEENTFLSIAEWESKALRDAMQADIDLGESDRGQAWQKMTRSDDFGEVIVVGRGDEINKVLPTEMQ